MLQAFIWLLLCYSQHARGNLVDEYVKVCDDFFAPAEDRGSYLPNDLGVDPVSGCTCRASVNWKDIVCFGNYACRKFPRITEKSELLRVRTSVIDQISIGELDNYKHLSILEIEANHQLRYLQPGIFRNLSRLQSLSISYNTMLRSIDEELFVGLVNLRNLTVVNNGFIEILALTPSFKYTILPSLKSLDISENTLEVIPENAFEPMQGTQLHRLDINLCRLDFIHPKSFLPLKNLKKLNLGENDLNTTLIGEFLLAMIKEGINLTHLDLYGMGFRKSPPRKLLDIIAQTTIQRLNLAQNQFEIIKDDSFPTMVNIEVIDLRKISAITIGPFAFEPRKFPNLKVLLMGGNYIPGIHNGHLSTQLLFLDMSHNKGSAANPLCFEIDRDTFLDSPKLRVLNLSYNRIRSLYYYSFKGLDNLKILSMENGSIYSIGSETFKSTKRLEILNLANNPLTANTNLTSDQFMGLNELKFLILTNCGIKFLLDDDNIFESMPNITHLILKNNLLYYISPETLKPLKFLQVLDLSENLLLSWWSPLFMAAGVVPTNIYLTNNKISHFTLAMIQDINYVLENSKNTTTEIDLMDNVFLCDCSGMYKTYLWLEVNGSRVLKDYFAYSQFKCSSPDLWEDRRVAEYLSSIKSLHCLMYEKISNVMFIVWTTPSLVTMALVVTTIVMAFKYRIYLRYWIFLAKIALDKKFMKKAVNENLQVREWKYDAFVSYCNEDSDIVNEMICQLEGRPPFLKLCVYERDFVIGSFISEAVMSSITHSRYVILIISNNFAKSQWCRWETQLAEYHRLFLEEGTSYDPLVLIRVGEIDRKYLTMTLKYLLKTKIYHTWDEQKSDEFWKKLKHVLVSRK